MDSPVLHIRQGVEADAKSIASVLYSAFIEYEALYTPEGFSATTPNVDHLLKRWKEGPVWLAEEENVIAGTISAAPKGESLYIRSMAILPSARGKGIGKMLLQHVELYASEKGFRHMVLSTTPFLLRAIRLYEQFGFLRNHDGPHELFGTSLFTMTKTVPGRKNIG